MARASASVLGSGTVGPEPITAGSSPGTSEMAMVTTRAGCARSASRPPLMRERCLRTVLISTIDAPDASSARVTACLSVSERPAAGAIQLAEAPPETSASTRSSGPAASASASVSKGAGEAGGVGHRVAGLDHAHEPRRPPVAAAGDRKPADPAGRHAALVEIVALGDLGHGRGRLAGRQDHQASRRRRRRQMRRQAARGMRGGDRRAEQVFEKGAGRRGQDLNPDVVGRVSAPPMICHQICKLDISTVCADA